MNIIVLAPYSKKVLKALEGVKKINLGNIIVIGSKKRFCNCCIKERINYSSFTIYDYEVENVIIQKAKEIYKPKDLIICDEITSYYKKVIFDLSDQDDFDNLHVIDLPDLRHFLFVCNYNKKRNIDFDDKKKSIIASANFMSYIGIKKTNVAFVANVNTKADMLEAGIIKMIINDEKNNLIRASDAYKLYELFNKTNKINIYNTNINLLVMKNIETSQIFIDSLNIFTNCKIGSVMMHKNKYLISTTEMKDEENILFSILVVARVVKNQKDAIQLVGKN